MPGIPSKGTFKEPSIHDSYDSWLNAMHVFQARLLTWMSLLKNIMLSEVLDRINVLEVQRELQRRRRRRTTWHFQLRLMGSWNCFLLHIGISLSLFNDDLNMIYFWIMYFTALSKRASNASEPHVYEYDLSGNWNCKWTGNRKECKENCSHGYTRTHERLAKSSFTYQKQYASP